jgi:hypothetical protein
MTFAHQAGVDPALRAYTSMPDEEAEEDLNRILGDKALFKLNEVSRTLRVSMPTLYRGMRTGRIPFVWVGSRRALTRPVLKRLLREGIGPIS